MSITDIIQNNGFQISHRFDEPEKPENRVPYEDLNLCEKSLDFLRNKEIHTLWSHQYAAINNAKEDRNVCVTTSTSSGKTEIFILSALEKLRQYPGSKILAVYPMKALNAQQKERWERTGVEVGKIDGSVDMTSRARILQNSDIVVMTPDTIHAYLLRNTRDEIVCNFIQNISMVIIDELHLYKGLFGTNSAYLFRRLNNVRRLLRREQTGYPQYITASATMPNAIEHSANISGVSDFIEIGINQDGSPSKKKTFLFIEKANNDTPLINGVAQLVYAIAENDNTKSLTFVEGRQRAGEMAAFNNAIGGNSDETGIYPFRAGYEQETADTLTEHLKDGNFKGIISTSALEIGLDIEGLNIVIIADMPHDMNSYMQRIGRCGRYNCEGDSYVIIVKNQRSFASKLLFEHLNYEMERVLPEYEPALYLDDARIMATHAWLHVGDHDFCECPNLRQGGRRAQFDDGGCFPDEFVRLCNDLIEGQIGAPYSNEIEVLRNIGGIPHYECPLRSFGKQFNVVDTNGENQGEQIDRNRIASEAYPGAIRRTLRMNRNGLERVAQKVVFVDQARGTVTVRNDNQGYRRTTPNKRVFLKPNLRDVARHQTIVCGEASIYNLETYETIVIYGYAEIIGRNTTRNTYDRPFVLNAVRRTGTIFFHPSFQTVGVHTSDIAQILFETFLRRNAFDNNDINYLGGSLMAGNNFHKPGEKFVAIYDATEFNITKRILDEERLIDMFRFLKDHIETISYTICENLNQQTFDSLNQLCDSILENEIRVIEARNGDERTVEFKSFTEIEVVDDSDDSDAPRILNAIYLGKANQDNMVNVMFPETGQMVTVEFDKIRATVNTKYEVS